MRVIVGADGESSKFSPIKLFELINLRDVPLLDSSAKCDCEL